jgi:hypothetical protein
LPLSSWANLKWATAHLNIISNRLHEHRNVKLPIFINALVVRPNIMSKRTYFYPKMP